MRLLDFIKSLAPKERDRFAAECETSLGYLKQVGYGNKACGPALAIRVERASKGRVTCEELCPTADWQYVRGTAGVSPA